MARLFISQERLDTWNEEGRVKVEGENMTLCDDGRLFRISPAVRFLKVSGSGTDEAKLVGKVKAETELDKIDADHYLDSVILGEIAYDVQPGFLGIALSRL